MLTELHLENFKCFGRHVVIPAKRLTLLTGINANGKSTVLQALLILHQSIERALAGARVLDRIELNGRYAHLGTFREIQNRDRSKSEYIEIGLEFADASQHTDEGITTMTSLSLAHEEDSARFAQIHRIQVERLKGRELLREKIEEINESTLSIHLDFKNEDDALANASELKQLSHVHYVSADRVGPQDIYLRQDDEGLTVGARGERTAEVLYQLEQDQVPLSSKDRRYHANSDTVLISDQVNPWLSYIFDGGKVRVAAPHSTILTLEMNSDGSAHYHRPANVGFGYSYALPILVAGLIAKPGEILIVENPEAHLHPLAQSRLSEFLATVSAAGVQVFVESHSEHTLNAFRLAVKDKLITKDDLSVLYFLRDSADPIRLIEVDAEGKIEDWPDGFFDQRSKDFFKLFGQ